VLIEVADRGPAVPEHAFPRLFDRVYRVEGPHTGPGPGLGLAIVADVASAHGGTATACPNGPHGLRIRLVLPVLPVRPVLPDAATQPGEDTAVTACAPIDRRGDA
jgi:signal transduction histidine kinase